MEFIALGNTNECDCLKDAIENYQDTFARRISLGNSLKASDFKTHHERNKEPSSNACEEICGYRGISINIWNKSSSSYIIESHTTTMQFSPQLRKQIGIFRVKKNSGLFKYTPNQSEGYNPYHYDFYKSDSFSLDMIELIERLTPNV